VVWLLLAGVYVTVRPAKTGISFEEFMRNRSGASGYINDDSRGKKQTKAWYASWEITPDHKLESFAVLGVGPILCGWILTFPIIWITRWVIAGFRPSD
jgi:hypothetical protein